MMKSISFLLPLMVCGFIVFGCGFSDDDDRGQAPTIRAVYFYKNAATVPTSNVNVGDTVTAEVHLEDPDSDIVTLHIVIYDLSNPDTVYDGPAVYELDSVQVFAYKISKKLDAMFSAGEYRVDFQVVDEKGHASLIFRKKLYVSA
jgi:hypothetical protein